MILKKIAVLSAFVLVFATSLFGQDFPEKPNRLVNDYTGTLTPDQVESLERKLVAFDDSTSTQVAVVLMRSVGVYDINQYTAELGEKWGVGSKKNNGVVILAALEDRKVSIQTGYGVEGALPDAITKRIIENEIKPNFRAGDYYTGLDRATNAVIAATKGEYKNDQPRKRKGSGSSGFPFGILVLIIIAILISRRGGGGGGQVIGGRGGASPFWWLLMGSQMGRNRGSGWGGFSGGSDWGGGSGGGFGGFGGGRFGGGGSSGDW